MNDSNNKNPNIINIKFEKENEKFSTKNLVKPSNSEEGIAIYLSNANCIKTGLPAEKIENKIDAIIVKTTDQVYEFINLKAL